MEILTHVEVRNTQGSLLTLSLLDPSLGFIVEDVDGLDPVKATMVSSSFVGLNGEQYQTSKREKRNIIFKLKFDPDFVTNSVRGLRKQLMGFMMPQSLIHMRFFVSGAPTLDIYGRVESFDSPAFTKEPGVDISVLCFDPDFYDPILVTESGSSTAGATETPFVYDGSVESGFLFKLLVNRTMSEFTIFSRPGDDTVRSLEFVAPLVAGDVVAISTTPGSKGATLTRGGSVSSILYGISPQSNWLEFFPGTNYVRVYAEGAAVPYTIEYTTKYGAI